VFVCDDPSLSQPLYDKISRRRSAIRQPTSLILLAANGGFAHANNIGASYAAGDQLLLMNSDIYCRSFDFVHYAADLLDRDEQVGAAGFSLQFEDGTIQHNGMRFERAPWFDGLWSSEHHGKGLPHEWSGLSHEPVEAVTAALMLLRRRDFQDANIFDPGYIIGDFEDGDLCMRIRANNKSIVLVRTDGIYHLERQSVRHVGQPLARSAVTRLNCLRFNERWGTFLEAGHGA
jgi:GT2 family glycosyltransferase